MTLLGRLLLLVQNFCDSLDDWQITHQQKDLPGVIWNFIKQSGLFGMIIFGQGTIRSHPYVLKAFEAKVAERNKLSAI